MKTKIEIIEETKNYYAANPSRRGINDDGTCEYITDDGRMCAVGRCCDNPKKWEDIVEALRDLKPEYKGNEEDFWFNLQTLHDSGCNWNENGLTKIGEGYYEGLLTKYENEN